MVVAYALALKGISVRVLESAPTCMEDMRASTLHPPTLEMLESLGLRETLEAQGLRAPVYQYSNRTTGRHFTLDMGEIADVTPYPYRLQCEQFKLTRLIADKLAAMPNAEVLFSHSVAKIDQGANGVHVSVETPFDIKLFSADYLIGADGGNSTVRKWLGIGFDGFTYPETFLTLSTGYPIDQHLPWLKEVNYVSGSPFWCVALRVPDQWRVLVPVNNSESDEEVTSDARKDAVFAQLLGTNVQVETTHRTRYRVHQRVATRFRQGRVLLVGDSAHLNNPLGGFGMNSGVHDSMNLADKLGKVILKGADESLLDLYDRQRRTVTREFVQAQTIANKKAAEDTATGGGLSAREQMLARLEHDPVARHAYIVEQAMFKSLEREAEIVGRLTSDQA
jgi:3-(3-hydroxy-phenyl)propionate hydroxylase